MKFLKTCGGQVKKKKGFNWLRKYLCSLWELCNCKLHFIYVTHVVSSPEETRNKGKTKEIKENERKWINLEAHLDQMAPLEEKITKEVAKNPRKNTKSHCNPK